MFYVLHFTFYVLHFTFYGSLRHYRFLPKRPSAPADFRPKQASASKKFRAAPTTRRGARKRSTIILHSVLYGPGREN